MTRTPVIEKTDLYRLRRDFFRATSKPSVVDLEEATYLAIDGEGSPDDPGFQKAVAALFSLAYGLKFEFKRRGFDFKVPTFEGDWWVPGADSYEAAQAAPRHLWRWTLVMMLPDFVSREDVESVKARLLAKAKDLGVDSVRFDRFAQGRCVQVLHLGPYSEEPRTIKAMQAFMQKEGLEARGHHHEVYLGDPRRAKPAALKTILRQPVRT